MNPTENDTSQLPLLEEQNNIFSDEKDDKSLEDWHKEEKHDDSNPETENSSEEHEEQQRDINMRSMR